MGAARTNWHADRLPTLEIDDPFEVDVEEVGKPIDLSVPTATLDVRLVELLHREESLERLGVTCEIKALPDVVCSACPVSRAEDSDVPLGALCRVSREQEAVCTQLAVQRHAGR